MLEPQGERAVMPETNAAEAKVAKVGWWTTICCRLDLRQIADDADLAVCLEHAEIVGRQFWETKEAALRDLPEYRWHG